MKQLTSKKTLFISLFCLFAFIVAAVESSPVHASATAEKKAKTYCARYSDTDAQSTRRVADCINYFVAGYDGKSKAQICEGLKTCESDFDAGRKAQEAADGVAGSVEGAASPCADPKAIDPECVKTGRINLTNKDADKAGLAQKSADDIVGTTLNGAYTIVAIIAVIVIVLAGIRMITADGDSTKFAAARQTILYAVIGLAVVGSAFIITGVIQGIGTK